MAVPSLLAGPAADLLRTVREAAALDLEGDISLCVVANRWVVRSFGVEVQIWLVNEGLAFKFASVL